MAHTVEDRDLDVDGLSYTPTDPDVAHQAFHPPSYTWKEVTYNFSVSSAGMEALKPTYIGVKAEDLLGGQKLYVVVATIAQRIKQVAEVLNTILNGAAVPTHLYLMLSDHKFLLDSGVSPDKLPVYLKFLAYTGYITIVYTENIGPHRKLLPILSKLWKEDAVIVTFDDDRRVPRDSLLRLIKYYINSDRDSVIGLRVRRIGFCTTYSYPTSHQHQTRVSRNQSQSGGRLLSERLGKTRASSRGSSGGSDTKKAYKFGMAEYGACRWPRVQNRYVTREMMVLPTGNGGVLYRPRFFHPVVFDPILRDLTQWNDDLTFRLGTLLKGIFVVPGCCDDDFSYCQDLFTSLKDAVKRKSSLYDQNQARNSLMWRAALSYIGNSSYSSASTDSGKFNIFDLAAEFLPIERSTCGMDRDSPLKTKLRGRRSRRGESGSLFTLKNIVGMKPLGDKQRKALRKEGNKCGIHWCSSKEKQFNTESNAWIIL